MAENSAPAAGLTLLGGDIQQQIADISDVLFKMDGERLYDRVCDEITFAAARLKAVKLPNIPGIEGKIARGRLIERIKKAESEAEEIMTLLASRQTELYKAEAAYLCLRGELEKRKGELVEIRKKYGDGGSESITPRRISELEMSEMVADRYIRMTEDRIKAVRSLSEGIMSLLGNAYPLWRGAVSNSLESPVTENLSRAEYLMQCIISACDQLIINN